jgi:hypothetical protein
MLASRNSVNADLLTPGFRVSCKVNVGPSGLIVLLNDVNTSLIDLEDAYYSRLTQPAKIVSHLDTAHLVKNNLTLVVLSRREDLGPEGLARGGYSRLVPVPVLITTATFEIQGSIDVVTKLDPAQLLMGGTGRFLNVYSASALMAASPETVFSGAVILVSRTAVEMVAPITKGKA